MRKVIKLKRNENGRFLLRRSNCGNTARGVAAECEQSS